MDLPLALFLTVLTERSSEVQGEVSSRGPGGGPRDCDSESPSGLGVTSAVRLVVGRGEKGTWRGQRKYGKVQCNCLPIVRVRGKLIKNRKGKRS